MRTANPTLRPSIFKDSLSSRDKGDVELMTLDGAATKTLVLLSILVVAAVWVWNLTQRGPNEISSWMMGGMFGGLILGIATIFNPKIAPYTAPLYAGCEGFAIGGLSATFEMGYPGIAIQATVLTFGTLAALLLAYKTKIIQVTEGFRSGVIAATGGICIFYLVSWVMSLFGANLGFMGGSSNLSIGISFVVVAVAALNLVLDFEFIKQSAARGAPKYMEWYGAFGLMVTLIWLYVEILHLLAKLQGRKEYR